jgi:hypothetical protein
MVRIAFANHMSIAQRFSDMKRHGRDGEDAGNPLCLNSKVCSPWVELGALFEGRGQRQGWHSTSTTAAPPLLRDGRMGDAVTGVVQTARDCTSNIPAPRTDVCVNDPRPHFCESNAPVRATVRVVSPTFGTMSYFALYE